MTTRLTFAVAASLTIAACTAEPSEPAATKEGSAQPAATASGSGNMKASAKPDKPADTCGAGQVKGWISAQPTRDIKAQIAKTVGDRPIRYFADGDPVTMDFSEARLNVVLGASGRIAQFRCG